jgi:predicted DCC family thiol-disulfide oxidoreductase YuxK
MKLKKDKAPHIIFFDDTCPLCWRSVHRILAWDRKKKFRFIPIRDAAFREVLQERWKELRDANTLILVENYATAAKVWIQGRAVMRILWLLGGWRKPFGLLAFFPFGIDAVYSFVAKRRHRF